MSTLTIAIASAVAGAIVGGWIASLLARWTIGVEVRRLQKELRLRQLYAEGRRHELALLLRIWSDHTLPPGPALEKIGEELESQARGAGLNDGGHALEGYGEARPLWPAEWAELARLTGVPGAVRS